MRKKKRDDESKIDDNAYDQDLNQFLNGETRKEFKSNINKEEISFDTLLANDKNFLKNSKKDIENDSKGLESLLKNKHNDGTRSIVDIKLPSEILQEQSNKRDPNPEQNRQITQDLQNLSNNNFLELIKEEDEFENHNNSTFFMLDLLKRRGIAQQSQKNGDNANVTKKDRNERFIEDEKNRLTNDAQNHFYEQFVDQDLNKFNIVKGGLEFNKHEFLMKKKEIRLDYRDKQGKFLSRKQAFNDQCMKFHGMKRSITKEEKLRKKREKRENEKRKTDSKALPSFFNAANKITNKPFINLSKDFN